MAGQQGTYLPRPEDGNMDKVRLHDETFAQANDLYKRGEYDEACQMRPRGGKAASINNIYNLS